MVRFLRTEKLQYWRGAMLRASQLLAGGMQLHSRRRGARGFQWPLEALIADTWQLLKIRGGRSWTPVGVTVGTTNASHWLRARQGRCSVPVLPPCHLATGPARRRVRDPRVRCSAPRAGTHISRLQVGIAQRRKWGRSWLRWCFLPLLVLVAAAAAAAAAPTPDPTVTAAIVQYPSHTFCVRPQRTWGARDSRPHEWKYRSSMHMRRNRRARTSALATTLRRPLLPHHPLGAHLIAGCAGRVLTAGHAFAARRERVLAGAAYRTHTERASTALQRHSSFRVGASREKPRDAALCAAWGNSGAWRAAHEVSCGRKWGK